MTCDRVFLQRLCFAASCLLIPCLEAAEPEVLRVLSYNIHHGQGIDGKLDLNRIAKVIRSVSPDIVALQEVDRNADRSGDADQPAQLAQHTGMQVVFGDNIDLPGRGTTKGRYGNALLSKLPIIASSNSPLPVHQEGEQRGLLTATLKWNSQSIDVLATHLDHRSDDSERLASVDQINALLSVPSSTPMLLMGDLNATRDSGVLQRLRNHWTIAGSDQPTIPVRDPKRQIDFILYRPADRWEVVETRVLEEQVASDHRAILAVLRPLDPAPKARPIHRDILEAPNPNGNWSVAVDPEQWSSRRQAIVAAMQKVMGELPARPGEPPKVTLIEETDCGDYVRRKITYRSQPKCETPAYLCIPKQVLRDPSLRTPAILCLHPTDNAIGHDVVVGLGGKANRQYASELAQRGYVTLSPSYPLLAGYQPDLQALGWQSGTQKAIWDNMRGIDLLESMTFVDKDKFGAIGHSLGGHNSIFTAVFDQRIKGVVSSCGFDAFPDYYGGDQNKWKAGKGWTQLRYMPKLADYQGRLNEIPFDFDQLLAALSPRSVLIVAPLHDSNFQAASVDRVTATARKVFALHGSADQLRVLHPDCNHDFPAEYRESAYQMFDVLFKRVLQ
ncbi:MAG: endonuclease/exonuclease/phosphatase family protein [Rubripirellula sp.]